MCPELGNPGLVKEPPRPEGPEKGHHVASICHDGPICAEACQSFGGVQDFLFPGDGCEFVVLFGSLPGEHRGPLEPQGSRNADVQQLFEGQACGGLEDGTQNLIVRVGVVDSISEPRSKAPGLVLGQFQGLLQCPRSISISHLPEQRERPAARVGEVVGDARLVPQEVRDGDVVGVVVASNTANSPEHRVRKNVRGSSVGAERSPVELSENHGECVELCHPSKNQGSNCFPSFLEGCARNIRNQNGGLARLRNVRAGGEGEHPCILRQLIKH